MEIGLSLSLTSNKGVSALALRDRAGTLIRDRGGNLILTRS